MDEITAQPSSGPLHWLTIRLFDDVSQRWRLYWASQATGVFGRTWETNWTMDLPRIS